MTKITANDESIQSKSYNKMDRVKIKQKITEEMK